LEIDVPVVYAEKVPARAQKLLMNQVSGREKEEQEDLHLSLNATGLSSDCDAAEGVVPE